MSKFIGRFTALRQHGYWANRISRELDFVENLLEFDPTLSSSSYRKASSLIDKAISEEGSVTRTIVLEAEELLSIYAEEAKSFVVHCVGHAHIDMNWMWGMHETVSIVLETFRTMLKLMDEYPDFTFAQSQAATYRIVQQYEPEMLQAIKKRVAEGRWEVTASAWTEFDKNLSSGESHYHQYRDALAYVKDLLEIEHKTIPVGFEPDTFGHNQRLVDILSQFGIRYYYHCRGQVDHTLYRWRGLSGAEVLVYREPTWYLGPTISPVNDPSRGTIKALEMDMASEVISMAKEYGMRHTLQVYGVGDHGGGPTRMDIEGLQDMANWPIYPTISFSSYQKFFEEVESFKDTLPVVTGEINNIFTGCYTSQSAIKQGNHDSEISLYEAELFSSLATFQGVNIDSHDKILLKDSWEHVLFNQFHDILPGSCTPNSKNYSLGLYQTVKSGSNTVLSHSLQKLALKIDTSSIKVDDLQGMRALSAGFGYQAQRNGSSPFGSTEGLTRIVTLYNSTMVERTDIVEVLLWDWEDSLHTIMCHNSTGKRIPTEMYGKPEVYWQHSATKVLVPVTIAAFGYTTLIFEPDMSHRVDVQQEEVNNPRYEHAREYVLENEHIRAVFSPDQLDLISLEQVKTGEELLSGPSSFVYLEEDASDGMTAWIVGRESYPKENLFEVHNVKLQTNTLQQSLSYELAINRSRLAVQIVLKTGSNHLTVRTQILWHEFGDSTCTPQLSYALHLKETDEQYVYGVPYGTIKRSPSSQHVPSLGWVARSCKDSTLQISTRGIYGFCSERDHMRVILLRSSSDPDPLPEIGEHTKEFTITVHNTAKPSNKLLLDSYLHSCSDVQQVVHTQHEGSLPLDGTLLQIKGPFMISAIESLRSEDMIEIRGFETEGTSGEVSLTIPKGYCITQQTTVTGNVHDSNTLRFSVKPYEICSLYLKRAEG